MNKLFVCIFLIPQLLLAAEIIPPLLNSPVSLNIKPAIIQDKEETNETIEKIREATKWGGRALTQAKKNINGIDVNVFSITGGAWILHNNVKLSARSIELIGEDAVAGYLKGGIVILDKDNGTTLTASKGVYDKFNESVTIEGDPVIVYKNKNGASTVARSRIIYRNLAEAKTELQDYVEIHNQDYTMLANHAFLFEKEDRYEIPGHPMIFGKDTFMNGESLVYDGTDGNIYLKNNPVIIQRGKKEEKDSDPKEQNENAAEQPDEEEPVLKTIYSTANELVIHKGKTEMESFTGLTGNARVISENHIFSADYIKTYGETDSRLEAKNNIIARDKAGKMFLKGETLEFDQKKQYAHITDNVSVEFVDEETQELKSKMTAIEIERFMDREEMVARGNVVITGPDYVASGAYATYYEKEKKIHLEGNPVLQKDNKKMSTGTIVIYPEENKLYLKDGIKLKNEDDR